VFRLIRQSGLCRVHFRIGRGSLQIRPIQTVQRASNDIALADERRHHVTALCSVPQLRRKLFGSF